MAKPVFSWLPNEGSSVNVKPDVNVTSFHDEFEVRTANGINNMPEEWQFEITKNLSEITPVRNFLRARGGVESFLWTNPHGVQKTFICEKGWSEKRIGTKLVTMRLTFTEVFEV